MTALTGAILATGIALTALLYAFGGRRLPGLQLPLPPTLIAGGIAYLLVSPIINATAGPAWAKRPSILPLPWFVILGVTTALLAGMTFLVVAETFIPSGSTPGPLYLARGVRNGLGRTKRYSQIGRILVRRGLLPYLYRGWARQAGIKAPGDQGDRRGDEQAQACSRARDRAGRHGRCQAGDEGGQGHGSDQRTENHQGPVTQYPGQRDEVDAHAGAYPHRYPPGQPADRQHGRAGPSSANSRPTTISYRRRTARSLIGVLCAGLRTASTMPAITTRIPSPMPVWSSSMRSPGTAGAMAHPNQAAAKYPSIAAAMPRARPDGATWRLTPARAGTPAPTLPLPDGDDLRRSRQAATITQPGQHPASSSAPRQAASPKFLRNRPHRAGCPGHHRRLARLQRAAGPGLYP